ncbi:MAG TPA: saccharopine dehydrogenase NADP-binding domain-containing protein [Candidatus Egerieimonas intestinavium]|uniref:Saccharopine dehydrogenase NADP-binding domain-containing protein n=1 Tax=Candidatus Egerieimonas intestinavium TaxID=2840777 RepID=A0A9D1EKI1_9FIRM|nr:saccharopine dehydrogenase NADP-binding domain-containing protein [Candidatus Egerieimonas intestinavium]
MKVFCLGAAGRISRESALDLVQYSDFEKITIGDYNVEEAQKVAQWLNDDRVDVVKIDVTKVDEAAEMMKGYDVVMDGTQITLNGLSTECIAKAGCHGVNLNGFGEENKWDGLFKEAGKACVPGFGMTPGTTQMMAMHLANQLDTVEEVYVSHGAFRPFAFSKSITETTTYEYDPNLESRVVFEDGKFIQVPPFARPRKIDLPQPYGETTQYIIPHSETVTLAQALKDKGVRLIEVRGTWPQQNMTLVRGLYDYGILKNPVVKVGDTEKGLMSIIGDYLVESQEGKTTKLYGYALHVEVVGYKDGVKKQGILYHTHPASDGSVEGWEGLRAYTRNVGIPLAIAAEQLAKGQVKGTGILIPEDAFEPEQIFKELERRGIYMHESWNSL